MSFLVIIQSSSSFSYPTTAQYHYVVDFIDQIKRQMKMIAKAISISLSFLVRSFIFSSSFSSVHRKERQHCVPTFGKRSTVYDWSITKIPL
jgi:hypothetical protein